METIRQQSEIPLSEQGVDMASEQIEAFLTKLNIERAQVLRSCLSMEEALLRWMDHVRGEQIVTLDLRVRFGRPQISMLLQGERYNPLVQSENEIGEWMQSLFSGSGLMPVYSYRQGINTVQIKLNKAQRNPAITLLIALILGTLIGLAGYLWLPQAFRDTVLRTVLDPVQNVFFRVLNATAGPVIFLSVLTAICGVGSLSIMNSSGRRMIGRFMGICLLLTTILALLMIPIYHIVPRSEILNSASVSGGLDLLFQLIPNDLLSPFISCNSPQLILVALLLGDAFLLMGSRSEMLTGLVQQANTAALTIADWIGRLSPFFVGALLILDIWKGAASHMLGIWKPMTLFLLFTFLALLGSLLRVSLTKKVPFRVLLRKVMPSMREAFRTASVDASFSENLRCCTSYLGIHKSLTNYALPLGLVIYMPAGAASTLLFTFYAAKAYHVPMTWMWIVTAVLLTTVLIAASPPVAGVGLLAYAALFTQLGIPNEALMMVMAADILFGFMAAAANQTMLQMELVLEADRLQMLRLQTLRDETVLRQK